MGLVGIARLAASAQPLESKRAVSYSELPTRSWINRCSSPRMPFRWTINPYRGCEFACKYCYARYTHEFMELRDPEDFETRIFAKQFQPASFRSELASVPLEETIAIGTATDPYQPAERRYRLTRRMLEVLAEERGRRIAMISKSDLMVRDADVLLRIAKRSQLTFTFTITTMDSELARLLEPRAPRPDLRAGALDALTKAGIRCGAFSSPVLPGINDSEESLEEVARAAKARGGLYWGANILFLKSCSRAVFLPFLDVKMPHLRAQYRSLFDHSDFVKGPYADEHVAKVARIRERVGIDRSPAEYLPEQAESQLRLDFSL